MVAERGVAVLLRRNGGERGIIRPLMSVISLSCPRPPRFDETWLFVLVLVSNSGNGGAGLNSS